MWCSISLCFGQANNKAGTFGVRAGLSGQFFLVSSTKNIPYMSGAASTTGTTAGLGLPVFFTMKFKYWGLEVSPVLRYPKTKEWLVQRSGSIRQDERNWTTDLFISVIMNIQSPHKFLQNSWFGFGGSFFNLTGNINGSYYILTNTGWQQVDYSNMRMAGMHLLFGQSLSKKVIFNISITYIDGNQVKNKPNISFYLLSKLSISYILF